MLRSMYSGISGLRNFQTKLDVIGNNISNVNTYGFKKGRTIFKDLISQSVAGASGNTGTRGGVNPKQVGLGSQIAAIDTIHLGGSTQFTGNTLDMAISGDGFFQLAEFDEDLDPQINKIEYTRAGNFYMDNLGYLVNGDGKYVVGVGGAEDYDPTAVYDDGDFPYVNDDGTGLDLMPSRADSIASSQVPAEYNRIVIPTTAQSMSVGQDGTVSFVYENGELKYAGTLVMAKFPNPGGLDKVGGNYYQESANSGAPVRNLATEGGIGKTESGFLEMSNVDLAEEFTEMIVAQRGFQANTRIITTSDEILQELVNLKR